MEEPTHDPAAVYVGLLVTVTAAGFAYGGVRGLWLYAHDSGSAAADPGVSSLALLSSFWLAGLAPRLLRKHPASAPLLSQRALLGCSLAGLAGAGWSVIGGFPHPGFLLGALVSGAGGLLLWWRRRPAAARDG